MCSRFDRHFKDLETQIYIERLFCNISPYLKSRSLTAVNYLKVLAALMDICDLGKTT